MKCFSMIQLHRQGNVSIIYDFDTKHYYRNHESNTSNDGLGWLLIQPFAIYAIEAIGTQIDAVPGQSRFYYGMLAFIVGAIVCALSVEAFLYNCGRKVIENSSIISKPSHAELTQWVSAYSRGVRKIYYILGALAIATIGLVALFYFTGASIFLTIALCVFCVLYVIWGASNPHLLRRFAKSI